MTYKDGVIAGFIAGLVMVGVGLLLGDEFLFLMGGGALSVTIPTWITGVPNER